jgi:spore germination protein GerM
VRRRPSGRGVGGLLAAAVLMGSAGCGVVADGGPRAIPATQVPFHLLTRAVPTTTSTTAPIATAAVTVYFVAHTQQFLYLAQRAVPAPATLRTVLDELLAGPTTTERTAGVRTAIGDGVRLLSVRPLVIKPSTDVVTVDFNLSFGQISGTQQVQAVAQVVFTVAALLGPQVGVQFQIDGAATDVPTDTGAQVGGPVTKSQYASLTPTAPLTATTTTTSTTTTAPVP